MDKAERTSTRAKKSVTKSPNKKSLTPSKNNGKSNSTTVGASRESVNNEDTSDGEMVIEDENTWECSVCTYRNSQETFKCLMCDVCKGTSTRKPRYNHDLVAQKVKKQQIQIHQKLLKSSKHQQFTSTNDLRDSIDSKDNDKVTETRESKFKDHKEGKFSSKESLDDQLIERKGQHHHGKESKSRCEGKDGDGKVKGKGSGGSGGKGSGKQSNECLDEPGPSVNNNQHSQHESNFNKSNHNNCSSPSVSPNHNGSTSSSSSHHSPNANNHSSKLTKSRENLVNSSHKSSLMKMKNIDRTNFLAQAVTVNNVTVIITEFQPKKKLKPSPTSKKSNQRQSTGIKDTKDKN